MMALGAALEVDRVRRTYGAVVAVDNVSLTVGRGEFVTLLGPSGSGKTTTLRLVGGFEQLDSGAIWINGERIDQRPPYHRDTATIFQSGALFPHKTVAENVSYGLRMRKVAKSEIKERVTQALDVVRLQGFQDRFPSQLSGGQKQRVALARSLVVRPAVLLFDEPLSALDLSLRLQLRGEIKRLHDELGFSAIYVTHDQSEAMAMSSRVAVMNKGLIEQIDRPERVFQNPANEFVYNFIGESCCMPLRVASGTVTDLAGQPLDLHLGTALADGDCRLYVRPNRLKIAATGESGAPNTLRAKVHFVEFLGDVFRYHLQAGALEVFADHPGRIAQGSGDAVELGWQSEDMKVFQ
jgi:ABC-type Fe3+/spermidine/putrescine transport system ATPase subunit